MSWFPVAHRCELALPGSYVRVGPFDGFEVVAYNDGNEVIVFDNRCAHRGARIFEQRYGVKKLACLYHGWNRDNGKWNMPRAELFECEDWSPRLHASEWCGKWLFASVLAPKRALKDQLGAVAYEWYERSGKRIDLCIDHYGSIWRCEWHVAVENALEDLHVPLVHRTSLNKLAIQAEEIYFDGLSANSLYTIGDARMRRLLTTPPLGALADPSLSGDYATTYVFPYAQLSTTCGLTYALQLWSPEVGGRTAFSSRTYSIKVPEEVAPTYRTFCESAAAVNRQVFDEDREICNRVTWKATAKLGRAETKIKWFRGLCGRV